MLKFFFNNMMLAIMIELTANHQSLRFFFNLKFTISGNIFNQNIVLNMVKSQIFLVRDS
jgi:hypothetical protein